MEKTNLGLVEYAKAQLGLPYWMGTTGQTASEYLYNSNKARLPQYYTASDFPSQYGKRVHDCIGLVKGFMWSDSPTSAPAYASNGSPDHSADSMLTACSEKGTIDTIPDIPGILVFHTGHVGVYIGGGEVIEARGHQYGVVQTKLAGRGWKHWGKCPYITYEEDDDMAQMTDEQFAEYMARYEAGIRAKEEPDWSKKEGAWRKASEAGIVNGKEPEGYVKRCELTAVLDRKGLL